MVSINMHTPVSSRPPNVLFKSLFLQYSPHLFPGPFFFFCLKHNFSKCVTIKTRTYEKLFWNGRLTRFTITESYFQTYACTCTQKGYPNAIYGPVQLFSIYPHLLRYQSISIQFCWLSLESPEQHYCRSESNKISWQTSKVNLNAFQDSWQ